MTGRRRWTGRVVAAALVIGAISGFTVFEKASPQLLPTTLLVCAVVAILGLILDSGGADPPDWKVSAEFVGTSSGQDGGLATNVRLLENHLSARQADPLLRVRLIRLTDDRLARLGLRRGDPGVVQRLGPTLTGVLDGPPRTLQPAEIEECIRRIEELSMTQTPTELVSVADASALARSVLDEVEKAVIGKRAPLTLVLSAVLAKGHVLLEDFPGLGKTLAARSLARVLGLDFARVQFTPDLLPADITGSFLYNQKEGTFEFRRGPIFAGLVLADEINRTPPKTQSALLEAMQERQATVEGETFPLPDPFHVLATANPIEYEGTYPLPEAQLDRFLMRVSFGYPTADEEYDVVQRRLERQHEEVDLEQITNSSGLRAVQAAVETVTMDESVGRYCVDLATATRDHKDVLTGSSPRGSLGLALAARGFAVIRGRDYVIPEDVKAVSRAVLSHRVTVKPELWMTQASGPRVVDAVLASVPTPRALEQR